MKTIFAVICATKSHALAEGYILQSAKYFFPHAVLFI